VPELDDPKVRELLLIRHNPSSAEARRSLGQVLQQKKDGTAAEARSHLDTARRLAPWLAPPGSEP